MFKKKEAPQKIILVFIFLSLFILILSLVFVGGYLLGEKRIREGEVKFLKAELSKVYPPLPSKITRISGRVIEKKGNLLKVRTKIKIRPFSQPGKPAYQTTVKKVKVTKETEIYQIDKKGERKNNQGLPKIFLSLDDIKKGSYLVVSTDKDVRNLDIIQAKEIELVF